MFLKEALTIEALIKNHLIKITLIRKTYFYMAYKHFSPNKCNSATT